MCRSACSVAADAGLVACPLEHPVHRVVGQRPHRPAQRPPQRLAAPGRDQPVHLRLVEPQPHERVRRGGQLLQLPGALAGHSDQLTARIDAACGGRQQLRRPRPGGHIERDQRPVPVRGQPGEDLVELLVRDRPRDPRGHPGPVPAGALAAVRLHRVVMRARPRLPPGAVQRERVDDRPGAGIQVVAVETAQHRLAVGTHRRRIPAAVPPGPQPPAEIPGLRLRHLVPGQPGRPQEPEPAQQVHPVRPDRRLGPARRQQIPEERRRRPTAAPSGPASRNGSYRSPVAISPPDRRHHQGRQIPPVPHGRRLYRASAV